MLEFEAAQLASDLAPTRSIRSDPKLVARAAAGAAKWKSAKSLEG
jgi:hypothetical protein